MLEALKRLPCRLTARSSVAPAGQLRCRITSSILEQSSGVSDEASMSRKTTGRGAHAGAGAGGAARGRARARFMALLAAWLGTRSVAGPFLYPPRLTMVQQAAGGVQN